MLVCLLKMVEHVEQRIYIKFWVKIGEKIRSNWKKMGYDNELMSAAQIKQWYNRFKDGHISAESDEWSGKPSTSRNPKIAVQSQQRLVTKDHLITTRETVSKVGLYLVTTITFNRHNLSMWHISEKFIQRILIPVRRKPIYRLIVTCWIC